MKIEQVDIKRLKPSEDNAKIHTPEQVEQIKKSIQEFGFNDPLAIDENEVIIEGHGRLLALQELGYKKVECIRLEHLTPEQKKAYIQIHNQLTMNTGFDMEILEDVLADIKNIDMSEFGFDMDFTINDDWDFGDEDVDDPPLQPQGLRHKIKHGDVWQLGRHRLMCGDSTDAADVDKLTQGEEMDLCVTDPPYNVNYTGGTAEQLTILNDDMDDASFHAFLYDFYTQMLRVLKPGGAFYIFHADSEGLNFRGALKEAGGSVKQTIIWAKNALVIGRQDYQWKHEPCLYGWKDGAGHYFTNDRCQTTLFEARPELEEMDRDELLRTAQFLLAAVDNFNTTVLHEKKPARSELHPTMKPIALCARLIRNSSKRGEKVVDFFGGSGSTLIACEEAGRTAYVMELDPAYCDVIINRWEEATGEKAVKINGKKGK